MTLIEQLEAAEVGSVAIRLSDGEYWSAYVKWHHETKAERAWQCCASDLWIMQEGMRVTHIIPASALAQFAVEETDV